MSRDGVTREIGHLGQSATGRFGHRLAHRSANQSLDGPHIGRRALLAGGGALAAAAALGLTGRYLGRERHETARGEVRHLSLPDGSLVTLNTDSALSVQFGETERRIDLNRGEALFTVARQTRPFIVTAGSTHIHCLDSAFAVRHLSPQVDILVTAGAVRTWEAGLIGTTPPTLVQSGQHLSRQAGQAPALTPLPAHEAERRLAWRTGMIILEGESLGAAASDFNRYNRRRLVVADPALTREKVFGAFRAEDPEAFARAAAIALGAPLTLSEREIRIGYDRRT